MAQTKFFVGVKGNNKNKNQLEYCQLFLSICISACLYVCEGGEQGGEESGGEGGGMRWRIGGSKV